jgi:hypothetical protein
MSLEEQTTEFFSLLGELITGFEDVLDLEQELPTDFKIGSYGELYELSVPQIAAYLFKQAGLLDAANAAATKPDPQLAMLEMARSAEPNLELTPENAALSMAAMIILFVNLESMMLHAMPVSGLLERVSAGDDKALFEAVVLDASILSTKPVADRIATAAIHDDRPFFDSLAKAITRTKPVRPRPHLDGTRMLMQLFDDAGVLEDMSDSELTEWAVNRVGVYPDSKDPHSAIRNQRRKRDRAKGGPKS